MSAGIMKKWFILIGCWLNILAGAMVSSDIPDVDQYWPDVADDLSLVTWAHATNSKNLLQEALTNNTIMMIEADVLMGRLEGSPLNSPLLPIMVHPPLNISDLSLQEFVQEVLKAVDQDGRKKGIKLDFKQLAAVHESLNILSSHRDELSFPIWLNADILPGPVDATSTPVDAEVFLSLCVEFFPEATLSVGWTTRFTEAGDPEAQYTTAHVKAMLAAIETSHIVQPVTFPIRAAFVEKSLYSLAWLVTSVPDSTLTVWSSANDIVNMESLLYLQETIGPDQVYFDLPPAQQREFEALRPNPGPGSKSAASFMLWPRGAAIWASLAAAAVAMIVTGLYAPSSSVGGVN